jgi:hypothetical protein
MVDREDRHGRVHGVVAQRQRRGPRADGRRETGRALRRHHVTRLDCDHVPIAGLVGSRARADVDHSLGVAQRRVDERPQTRILATRRGIAAPDLVVARPRHEPAAGSLRVA